MLTKLACTLVQPTVDLENSHGRFVGEFGAAHERIVPWIAGEPYDSFNGYVAMLHRTAAGIDIPPGLVAHSTYWLLDDAAEIVAISNLRHDLSDNLLQYGGHIGYGVRPSARRKGYGAEILRRTLIEAQRRGITKARLTCDKGNVASEKTILRNGGQLDDEEYMPEHRCIVSRYWIEISPPER